MSSSPSDMSYTQFRYSYSASPQTLLASNALSSCYDCAGAPDSLHTPLYRDTPVTPNTRVREHETYSSYGVDSTCLYSLETIKDNSGPANARDSHGDANYLPELPFVNYQYEGCGQKPVDLNARRKNTNKETTSTLKDWLQEHRKNPYPTKGEKIMLAIVTKMTLTQVSTWFANARRRLKKENKMTWSPRNKASEEKTCDEDGEDVAGEMIQPDGRFEGDPRMDDAHLPQSDPDDFDLTESDGSEYEPNSWLPMSTCTRPPGDADHRFTRPPSTPDRGAFDPPSAGSTCEEATSYHQRHGPRIWTLARTAMLLQHDDYPACLHRGQGTMTPSVDCRSDLAAKRVDCPVTTLRNWVDGMFHGPPSSSRLTS